MAWDLCSKADVQSMHPISEAELMDEWSDMVEAMIRKYTRMPYYGKSVIITDEVHDGNGSNVLRVRKPPIVSVQAVKISGSALGSSDYVVFQGMIRTKYTTFPEGIMNISVDYTSGSTSVDDSVRLAATAMVIAIINYRKRHGADASLKWGVVEQKVGEESPLNVGLTSHLTTIMKRTLEKGKVRAR